MNAITRLIPALLFAIGCSLAAAQPYPSKPIRVIVPYPAGGAADITARAVSQKLSEQMGTALVVENRGGANGGIGTDAVAKAAPDGYTLLLVASGPIVVNPSLYSKVPYDPQADLAPISQVTTFQYVLVVPTGSPFRSVADIITAAKAQPKALSFGSTGIGGGGHLAGELLGLVTGTQLTHVPYKGSAPALVDLLSGQLSFTYDTVITSVPQIRAGKLRAFAVSGPKRAKSLPDVPTMQELGFAGFSVTQFQGFFAPARTDPAIVARLHAEIVTALRSPEVRQRLETEGGNDLVGNTPTEFAALIRTELDLYRKLIRDANIRME